MLCTLSDVKAMLKITDTSQDDYLTLLIKQQSALIEGYIGYKLARADYTEEVHSVNDRQLVSLNHFPIQSVSACEINGQTIGDYKILPEYSRWGRLYRGSGWIGPEFTRGFTHDIFAGEWCIKVSYTAGYYLPNDTGYVLGADNSLPYDITTCCINCVVERFNLESMGAVGLKGHTEGHISDTYSDSANNVGLSASAKLVLDKYVFYGVA